MKCSKLFGCMLLIFLMTGCVLTNDPIADYANAESKNSVSSAEKKEQKRKKNIESKSVKAIIGRTKYDSDTNVEYSGEYVYTIYAEKNRITRLELEITVPYVEVQGAVSSGDNETRDNQSKNSQEEKYKSNLDSNGYFGYKANGVEEKHNYHLNEKDPYTKVTLTIEPDKVSINDLKGYGIFHLESYDSWNEATYKKVYKRYSNMKDYMVRSEIFN